MHLALDYDTLFRRLTKRLQPTGRGAAASTAELVGSRPAAEAHVVRQPSSYRASVGFLFAVVLLASSCAQPSLGSSSWRLHLEYGPGAMAGMPEQVPWSADLLSDGSCTLVARQWSGAAWESQEQSLSLDPAQVQHVAAAVNDSQFTELLPFYPSLTEQRFGESPEWWRIEIVTQGQAHRVSVAGPAALLRSSRGTAHAREVKQFLGLVIELLRVIPSPLPDQGAPLEQLL
jgi:hypothetical protein